MLAYRNFLPLILLFLIPEFSSAQVKLPALFADHMVLQCNMMVPVWGWAHPGEKVAVTLGEHMAGTIADSEGKWKVRIGPLPAGGTYEMIVSGKNTIRIRDVLVGEVWISSGQSNMAMEVRSCKNAEEEISSANYPGIRHFQVRRAKAAAPLEDVFPADTGKNAWLNTWEVCDPSTVGHFSGSAYFFAKDLHIKREIPVGIIHASWGGTTAEAWIPMDTIENDPRLREILTDWPAYNDDEEWLAREYEEFVQEVESARLGGREEPLYFNQPSVLYNGIIAPVIPFGIRGVLWYQGESNAYRAFQYRDLFPAMITQWRKRWEQGSFPFLFVQLANYHFEPQVFPELREAQAMALSLPATAMAVAIDIGDSADIHPKNKQDVGRRLSIAAQATAYGETVEFSGPVYKKMFIDGDRCWILFDHVGDGLLSKEGGALKGFSISGIDKVFVEAEASIDGNQIIVWNEQIAQPVAVRYAWANHPGGANLYNQSGDTLNLPAPPFRTDTWPGITKSRKFRPEPVVSDPAWNGQTKSIIDLLQENELYAATKDIVNGKKWKFRKQYKGNPFLVEDYWPDVSLMYNGKHYTGFQINYDMYAEDFILLYTHMDSKKYIVLSNEKLESFSYKDTVTREEHLFKYFQIPGTKRKEIYETVYEGRTAFIQGPRCDIGDDRTGTFPGVYNRSFDCYIQVDGDYSRIHSKKSLLNALHRNADEIKKYVRKNRLKINQTHPENIAQVMRYYDEL
jgi:sialate O-acetylesterase